MSKVNCCRNTFLQLFACNTVLNTGVFPDRLKYAIVQPSFKKGNKLFSITDLYHYLLPSLILLQNLYTRLYGHVDNNILVNERYGFRNHTSTEQVSYMFNGILTAMNNNLIVGGIFCEPQKAFDYINYKILLDKIRILWN